MTGLRVRSFALAFAAMAVSAVAFIAPGTASAACTGVNIEANGASVEANAQALWEAPFNAKCTSTNEQVKYTSTSASKGLQSWWVGKEPSKYKGFGASNAFVAVDGGPNQTQENEILEKGPGSKVLSIPVGQFAITLPIHLPTGCTAKSGKKSKAFGRLTLSDATVQGIFAHTITNWTQVATYNSDVLSGTCSAPITRVVRKEGAGATQVLEKFLFEINKGAVDGSETWNQLAEEVENIKWPAEGENLIRAEKGKALAELVASTPGSIGYVNLNEVRQVAAFTPAGGGGAGTSTFWPELQSKGKKFEDPSTNLEENAAASANCGGELYISLNGSGKQGKFPPASTEDVWNEVVASTVQKKSYPLCGIFYVLSQTRFEPFSEAEHPTSAAEVETLKNYFTYILGPGQALLPGHDFLGLPTGKKEGHVLTISQEGVTKIAY